MRTSHLYKVNPLQLVLQGVIGAVAGLIGYFLVGLIGLLFFFIFFAAPAYGAAVAELMLKVNGRKRGGLVESVGVTSMAVGGLLPILLELAALHSIVILLADWRQLLGIALAAAACYGRLRYS